MSARLDTASTGADTRTVRIAVMFALSLWAAGLGCGRSSYGSNLDGVCGDGEVRANVEECDDGNSDNDDGCSTRCLGCDYTADAIMVGENGHCYSRHAGPVGWDSANRACVSLGGHLVTYTDAEESDPVVLELLGEGSDSWMGLIAQEWRWLDGTIFLYSNWAEGEPSNSTGDRAGAQRTDGTWGVNRRDAGNGYLCEIPGWEIRAENGNAYRVGYEWVTWDTARSRCEQAGGHLATISSADEAIFIEESFPRSLWAGARADAGTTAFQWLDGEPFAYQRWSINEPSGDGTAASCVVSEVGGWRDSGCNATYPYLCEIDGE